MREMTYKVTFSKDLVSSDGHPYKCVQETIAVVARTPEEATRAAQEQFQDRRNIRDWQLHADYVDVVEEPDSGEGPVKLLR